MCLRGEDEWMGGKNQQSRDVKDVLGGVGGWGPLLGGNICLWPEHFDWLVNNNNASTHASCA